MLNKGWNNPKNMSVVEVGSHTFVFHFQDEETLRRIMEKAPWHVMGYLVCLKWWSLQKIIHQLDF